ncbi:Holliday junction branch migration protein RuvA [bacterium]|nr:Holliday junction branch migration protein RuvA [bacterium]
MISKLSGKLVSKNLSKIILDVSGIGFEILISSRTFEKLPEPGKDFSIDTYMHVREDEMLLVGFLSQKEKELFLKIISVSGVSIKIALGVFSMYDAEELSKIIVNGQSELLKRAPGIGSKLSDRIILELKGKVSEEFIYSGEMITGSSKVFEVKEALRALGYSSSEIQKTLAKIDRKIIDEQNIEEILRAALKEV